VKADKGPTVVNSIAAPAIAARAPPVTMREIISFLHVFPNGLVCASV
jgi:hypothetical protein